MSTVIFAVKRPTVTFVTRILTHYRVPFHERVRVLLNERGINYSVIYGQPDKEEAAKGDLATLSWGTRVHNRSFFGKGKLVWQPIGRAVRESDLLILGQENQLLVNYPLQLLPAALRPRIGLWGHGRNFQARNPNSRAERWKRFWATRCDWWFAYTDESRRHVEALGFPSERITVFNNAVDTDKLQQQAEVLSGEDIKKLKNELKIYGDNTSIFVGGLYHEKRIEFLVSAADKIRQKIADFTLIIVGGGEGKQQLDALARSRPWLIVAGPRFDAEKAALMRMARLFLMPGLLGLAVLDAGSMGLPIVTTNYPWHSPEIAYLRDGETGIVVEAWNDVSAYAAAVIKLLEDEHLRSKMAQNALRHVSTFTIEMMAERFVDGVVSVTIAPLEK